MPTPQRLDAQGVMLTNTGKEIPFKETGIEKPLVEIVRGLQYLLDVNKAKIIRLEIFDPQEQYADGACVPRGSNISK